jgi:diguanylate cyclase (GGDEF)-like protein/PAS domain S-box-containing protein
MGVVGIALLMGIAASLLVGQVVGQHVQDRALVRLGELLDTVESTVSVACFTADEQLASEVVQGLLRNTEVRRALIRAGDGEIAGAERRQRPPGTDRQMNDPAGSMVKRPIYSPFNPSEKIGEVQLEVDWAAVDAQVRESTGFATALLAVSLGLVIVAAAAMMLFLVVRPIKMTSDRLHRLDVVGGERLAMPEGHERTEIGRLSADINQITGRLVEVLEHERTLRHQQEIGQRKYQDLFDKAVSGIFVADRDGVLDSVNRAFVELTWLPEKRGDARQKLSDAGWQDLEGLLSIIRASLDHSDESGVAEDDFLLVGNRGDERWLRVAVMPVGDGSVQGTVSDVTQRKREELSARRLAITDALTGFANRVGLHRAFADIGAATAPFALVMVDLDGFKRINDAMGFPVGDELLVGVAARLREALVETDFVARVGSDEFVLVLAGEQDRKRLSERIQRLAIRLALPYDIKTNAEHIPLTVSISIGIALYPDDGADIQDLLRCAELALNFARTKGGKTYQFFEPALQEAVEHRRRLEDELRSAVSSRRLQVYFQPIIDLRQGKLVGAEALLRWFHTRHGPVSPDVFVPLAEEIGLIGEIGLVVLDEACRHAALWRQKGYDIYVSVNISVRQIPDDLPHETVREALRRHKLPADAVAIEITEGVLMGNVSVAQAWIEGLRADGLRVFLDDFGTGYSSLSYLKRFTMDTVKIDKSFIRDMNADNSDRALVDAIITMAASLGMHVVAEGIEDFQQLVLLREMGCHYGQGYYFSRPVAAEDFTATAMRINAELAELCPSVGESPAKTL